MSNILIPAAELIHGVNATTSAPTLATSWQDACGRINGLEREGGDVLVVELDESEPDDNGDWLYMWSIVNRDGEYIVDNQCGPYEEVRAALLAFAVNED